MRVSSSASMIVLIGVIDRSQLVKDLENATNLFSGMSNFTNMDPSECAKLVVANR